MVESDIGGFGVIVDIGEVGKSVLVVVDVEKFFVFFEFNFFVNNSKFVVLELF